MPTLDLTTDQHREFSGTATASTDKREVAGIGVPLGVEIEVWPGFREVFDPECVFEGIDRAKLMLRHGELIGVIASHERSGDALNIVGKVSEIARGDEALTLARDGALDSFSIGFRAKEHVRTDHEDGSITVRHTVVTTRVFSLTPKPAYPDALVTDVRERPTAPPTNEGALMGDTLNREDLEKALEDQEREFDARLAQLMSGNREAAPLGDQWRSAGDFIKAVAAGDEAALEFHREYTGGKLADGAPKAVWLADAIKLVDKPRKIINRFNRQTLPDVGTTLEWYQLKSDTMKVDEVEVEGSDLPFGKVELESKNTKVRTFGGYTELTRMAIERSTSPLVSTAHRALGLAYSRRTETYARAYLYAQLAAQAAAGNKLEITKDLSAMTADDFLDLIIDASEIFDDRGFAMQGAGVSKDVFKLLMRLKDGDGRRLMSVYGAGVNQVGEINLKGARGNLASVEFEILPSAPVGTLEFDAPEALSTFESPGAPVQLQDENIINLSKAFSVYGYAAWSNPFPTALLPVTRKA